MARELDLDRLGSDLLPLCQQYLDRARSSVDRIISLWEVGDLLKRRNIGRPHGIGAALQEATRGAVTRAIVFRGAKARAIWASKSDLQNELHGLRSVQYFNDMLAVLDQGGHGASITAKDRAELVAAARTLGTADFKGYLVKFKRNASKDLGKGKKPPKKDVETANLAQHVELLVSQLKGCLGDEEAARKLREAIPSAERATLVNLVIAVANPLNRTMLREQGTATSESRLPEFSEVYNRLYRLARMTDDTKRSRLRKQLANTSFSDLAGLLNALRDDDSWKRYAEKGDRAMVLQRRV